MEGNIDLIYARPINTRNILTFTFPTMVRMLFVSMYTIVDGIVVSNYVGSLGLSALNIVYPVLNVVMALTFVFQMGSNAVIGKKLGEGKARCDRGGAVGCEHGVELLRRGKVCAIKPLEL